LVRWLFVCLFPALLSAQETSIAITNVTVIDGTDAAPRTDQTVIITGTRIASVAPAVRSKIPADAAMVDGTGKFLIPGLWDMHTHLTNYGETSCPVLVSNGVTGIRDCGGDLELIDLMRQRIANQKLIGPEIFRAGPFVDGSKPGIANRFVVSNAEEAREVVDFLKKRNVDFIKTHTATPPDAYFALIEAARSRKIAVIGHIPMDVMPEDAIEAGQHSVEHVVSLFEGPFQKLVKGGKSQEQAMNEFTDEYFRSLARRMVSKRTWFDPTLIAYWNRSFQWDVRARKDPNERYITASAREFWKFFPDLPPERKILLAKAYERFSEITGILHREGVRFLVGTDLAAKYSIPGLDVHAELDLLVKAGLSPRAAIQAATRNCAESLGVLDRTGTIEPGKSADLVLLDANPLEQIGNSKKINAVIRNGRLFRRADLDAILDKAAADAPLR
jgi:imidazolonepropionase-like amidohydrolase